MDIMRSCDFCGSPEPAAAVESFKKKGQIEIYIDVYDDKI